jgi:hypothetical protein
MKSQDDDFGAVVDFATMRGRDYPSIRQFTVFLENRVGILFQLFRRFKGSKVRIMAMNILDSTECCIVRFVLSHPEQGREILERAGLAMVESDLIGLELPDSDQPLLDICGALLRAEVNLLQSFPLMVQNSDQNLIAIMVDNLDAAQETLTDQGFKLISENDLMDLS